MKEIKDTIKELEKLDSRLNRAVQLEKQAEEAQRLAAGLRDDADEKLRQAQTEKLEADRLLEEYKELYSRGDDELKGREKTLAAKAADCALKSEDVAKSQALRGNEQVIQAASLAKREAECLEREEKLYIQGEKYKAVVEYINNTL